MLALIVSSYLLAMGQSGPSGTLIALVQDPNGANLPGVSVTVRNLATGAARSVTTNEEGRWTMPALAVGVYKVDYEMTGQVRYRRGPLDLCVG